MTAISCVQVGFLVLFVVLGVALRHPIDAPRTVGVEKYRLSEPLLWICLSTGAGFALTGLVLGVFSTTASATSDFLIVLLIGDVVPALLLYVFIYYRILVFELDDEGLSKYSLFGRHRWLFRDIRQADISIGFLGEAPEAVVTLFDARGKKIAQVTGNFNDFERFMTRITYHLQDTGAVIRKA